MLPGVLAGAGGVIIAAWVTLGRALFGIAGGLTPLYVFTVGIVLVVLALLTADAMMRAARRGFAHRPVTLVMLFGWWGCGLLLGFIIPDVTSAGLQTIATGTTEPGRGIAVGFSNPIGIIMLFGAIAAMLLARGDARGRAHLRPVEE